jgi:hypothetical protein
MRIRQLRSLQQRRIPAGSPFRYAAPTELTRILETGSYKDSAPTELQTRQELQTGHSEFQNLVGVDSSAARRRPGKRGRSIRT